MANTCEYWVGKTIGEGSYGKVVHARHKKTNKNVAIKVFLRRPTGRAPSLQSDVFKECTLLRELKSDFVVPLWAAFHDEECFYFVMECMTGGDLAHLIQCGLQIESSNRQETTTQKWIQSIPYNVLQLLSALEFIHSHHVVHADLKPQNVLVSSHGKLKLADFGSAIRVPGPIVETETDVSSKPLHLRNMGTADYASPEVVRGDTLGSPHPAAFAIDLWSLGCIVYTMWEGESPFHAATDALAVQRIVKHCQDSSAQRDWSFNELGTMTLLWKELIQDLLRPDASQRLGMADLIKQTSSDPLTYASIRALPCFSEMILGNDDASREIFLPTEPSWWANASKDNFRDGAEGWTSFLLS